MTEYFQKNLFKHISMEEYKSLLTCLDGRTRQFRAGDIICDYDKGFDDIGIIGKGSASVVRYEYGGSRTIPVSYTHLDVYKRQNYRSTPEILSAALPLISHNQGEPRELIPMMGHGSPVRVAAAESSLSEAIFIAKEIGHMVGGIDMLDAHTNSRCV